MSHVIIEFRKQLKHTRSPHATIPSWLRNINFDSNSSYCIWNMRREWMDLFAVTLHCGNIVTHRLISSSGWDKLQMTASASIRGGKDTDMQLGKYDLK